MLRYKTKKSSKINHNLIAIAFAVVSCGSPSDTESEGDNNSSAATQELLNLDYCVNDLPLELNLTSIYERGTGKEVDDSFVNSDKIDWTILNPRDHKGFSGVGRYGNCTGTLLDTGGNYDTPAYVITNGHCIGTSLLPAEGAFLNKESNKGKKFFLNYFDELTASDYEVVENVIIRFASMDHTDAAIVELNSTYGRLRNLGYCSYKIAEDKPVTGQKLTVAGVPQSGVDLTKLGLRASHCEVGDLVSLEEGPYRFSNSFEHRCSIVGGSSGSPIFDRESMTIVGLVNTTVSDGFKDEDDCALQKPCEVSEDGSKVVDDDVNYGQIINYLHGCFNDSGVFDHELSTCGIKAFFE